MKIRNTREYISPEKFRFVMLLYGISGTGKTKWIGTCPVEETGIAACETGVGNGLLTIAEKGFDHVVPENLKDLEDFVTGKIFPDKKILVLDSLSAMAKTFIKDAALQIPRGRGESEKRKLGVPEQDDYGVIAALTAKLLNRLIQCNPDKHILVTATERWDRANENDPPGTENLFGPQLAGAMFLEAPALFDFVLRMRVRSTLKNPNDAKSRTLERFFQTDRSPGIIAKCRSNDGRGKALLASEEVFDIDRDLGTFPDLLRKVVSGYEAIKVSLQVPVPSR